MLHNLVDPAEQPAKTLVEAARAKLQLDILTGALAPESKLRVEHLKSRYGIGSSTLREALTLLVTDGLVTSEGQRGFRVAPVSLADFQAITEMRILLETKALHQSIEQGDDDWEGRIVAAFHRLSKLDPFVKDADSEQLGEWERRNDAFHASLLSACNNPWLFRFYGTLLRQSSRYLRLSIHDHTIPRDVHKEHRSIMDATLNRDAKEACKLTEDHIRRTVSVVSLLCDDGAEPNGKAG